MTIKIGGLEIDGTLIPPIAGIGDFFQNKPIQRNGYVYLDKEFFVEILSFLDSEHCELRYGDEYNKRLGYFITKSEANKIVNHFGLFEDKAE